MISEGIAAHHKRLIAACVARGVAHHDAEDAAQETWLKLHRAGQLEAVLSLPHAVAILTLAVRQALLREWTRRSRRKRGGGGGDISLSEMLHEPPDTGPTPDRAADLALLRNELAAAQIEDTPSAATGAERVAIFRRRQAARDKLRHWLD